jgi:hypothetical protein
MIDPEPARRPPSGPQHDRTLKVTTITIAVAALGLSGAFTYQAASTTTAGSVGTAAAPAASQPQPQPNAEGDDGFVPTGAVPPRAGSAGQPVAVSGGS